MKASSCALSLLVVLLGTHWVRASSPHTYEGVGEARVAGGNVVSARRQALARARSAALAMAIASVADPALLPEPIHGALLGQSALIRTYRVLKEAREGGVFRLKVAIQVDMVALRRQLLRRGVKTRARAKAADRALALWVTPALRAAVERGLRGRGYRVVSLRGTREQARKQAQGKAALIVFITMHAAPAAGVRGLGLRGAQVTFQAEARSNASWAQLGTLERRGWGAGQTPAAAEQDATLRALPLLVRDLVALLNKHATSALAPGDVLVGVAGLQGLAEMNAICAILRAKEAQSCAPRQLEAGRVWLHLSGTAGIARVVRLLTAHDFSAFALALERTQQARAWLRVRRGAPAAAATAP